MEWSKAVGAMERGEIVEGTVTYRYRKTWDGHFEQYHEQVGEWTRWNMMFDILADYEISSDPKKPAELEPLAIEAETTEVTE